MAPEAAARQELKKKRTPRLDWPGSLLRTFARDTFRLPQMWRPAPGCVVREGSGRRARDCGAPGTAHGVCKAGPGSTFGNLIQFYQPL